MLKTVGLTKAYEATVALDAFDFEVLAGEVVGVIGENGAGKSTLMKLLSGIIQPTAGHIEVDEKPVRMKDTTHASRLGIQIVHQELNLIPTLSAEDNLFLGAEKGSALVDRNATRREAVSLLDRVGAKFAPTTLCEDLSIAEQQLVEIAKALSKKARLLILDEPTAVLSDVESRMLFDIVAKLRADGVAILYVSHRLPEILEICSRIVVLRDGQKVADQDPTGLSESDLANLMVGRKLEDVFPTKAPIQDETVLEVESFSVPGYAKGVSFSVRAGEILGFAGLIGSGRTETCEGVVGVRSGRGKVSVRGKTLPSLSITATKKAGLVYVSEDRKGKGLVVSMSIEENMALANLNSLNSTKKRLANAAKWISDLKIKVPDASLPMTSLSGGNQQKCSVAKWLETDPAVIILDEPTRGIDVGSKAEMYRLIASLAESGLACIVISSEMPELIGLAHRVAVFREGRIVGELVGEDISEAKIMALAAGVEGEAA
ncbi:MAG: sugar ABC transporter ATP-binding protein [Armatimonadetes bacterium]|nr:sugar ABC transporter ATP-binding protein [Armatimonadota bacterium]